MKRAFILTVALFLGGVSPLWAQVEKQVEVTKTYIPEVSHAVKLPLVPDMTDTVHLRPEIDYAITPLALATDLSTEPFRPATITYWEFNRPRTLYLKAGAGAPFNSVVDLYASTQNPGTGYAVGYLNHAGHWAKIRNDFGVRPTSWRMENRLGGAAGKYLGRHMLEGQIDLANRVYHRYALDEVANDAIRYNDAAIGLRIGDDFTDLSRFNFSVDLHGNYFTDRSDLAMRLRAGGPEPTDDRYHETALGGGVRLGKAFGNHAFGLRARYDGTWGGFDYASSQWLAALRYGYSGRRFTLRAGLGIGHVENESDLPDLRGAMTMVPRSESDTYLMPELDLTWLTADGRFTPYVRLESRIRGNDLRHLSRQNPYMLVPVNCAAGVEYRVRGGISGRTRRGNFSYDLYVGFGKEYNALFWMFARLLNDSEPTAEPAADPLVESGFLPFGGTLNTLSVNAAFEWRPSSHFRFAGEVHACSYDYSLTEPVWIGPDQPVTEPGLGRPQFTAELRGGYEGRKVSLELAAEMLSARSWSCFGEIAGGNPAGDPSMGTPVGKALESSVVYGHFKSPVTVDLKARFNWFFTQQLTFFAEGSNLCDAKLYNWALYRDYGVGFTVGVKLQF